MKHFFTFSAIRETLKKLSVEAKKAVERDETKKRVDKVWEVMSRTGVVAGAADVAAHLGGFLSSLSKSGPKPAFQSLKSKYILSPTNAEMLTKIYEGNERIESKLDEVLKELEGRKVGSAMVKKSGEDPAANGSAEKPDGSGGGSGGVIPVVKAGENVSGTEEKSTEKGSGNNNKGGSNGNGKNGGQNGKNGGGDGGQNGGGGQNGDGGGGTGGDGNGGQGDIETVIRGLVDLVLQ